METCDGKRERRYKQVFSANMTKKGTPKITACKASDNWTCISFRPDLAKFGMEQLEEDTVALMRKRVYDLAGILGKGVKVRPPAAGGAFGLLGALAGAWGAGRRWGPRSLRASCPLPARGAPGGSRPEAVSLLTPCPLRPPRPPPQVLLNGTKLPVKAFQDYVDLYLGPKDNAVPRVYEKVNDRWEIVVSTTEGQFNQVPPLSAIYLLRPPLPAPGCSCLKAGW